LSFPLPVSLKRFLAPLWVFIFGMGTDLLLVAGAGAPGVRHRVDACWLWNEPVRTGLEA
jgi:hypothetical protein